MRRLLNMHSARKESGIALIVVLIIIVVLGVLAAKFATDMKVETTLGRHASFSSELDWMGRSGIEVAKWVLAQSSFGPNARADSLKQKWAGGPGETNDILAAVDLENYALGNGTISIKIQDLDRKFNINVTDQHTLKQAMEFLIGVDPAVSATVVGSILDWRDQNDDPVTGGTESSVYEAPDPPYFAKNGPIDDLSELLLVRGVTPNMYWGSRAGSAGQQVFNRPVGGRRSAFDAEPIYERGLVDLFTAISSRFVNINTASEAVLQMAVDPATGIAPIDKQMAELIIRSPSGLGRAGPDMQDGTSDDIPYTQVMEVTRVMPGVPAQALSGLTRVFTVRSLVFEAHVTASVGSSKREYVAVLLRRGPKDIQTLNLYWK